LNRLFANVRQARRHFAHPTQPYGLIGQDGLEPYMGHFLVTGAIGVNTISQVLHAQAPVKIYQLDINALCFFPGDDTRQGMLNCNTPVFKKGPRRLGLRRA